MSDITFNLWSQNDPRLTLAIPLPQLLSGPPLGGGHWVNVPCGGQDFLPWFSFRAPLPVEALPLPVSHGHGEDFWVGAELGWGQMSMTDSSTGSPRNPRILLTPPTAPYAPAPTQFSGVCHRRHLAVFKSWFPHDLQRGDTPACQSFHLVLLPVPHGHFLSHQSYFLYQWHLFLSPQSHFLSLCGHFLFHSHFLTPSVTSCPLWGPDPSPDAPPRGPPPHPRHCPHMPGTAPSPSPLPRAGAGVEWVGTGGRAATSCGDRERGRDRGRGISHLGWAGNDVTRNESIYINVHKFASHHRFGVSICINLHKFA